MKLEKVDQKCLLVTFAAILIAKVSQMSTSKYPLLHQSCERRKIIGKNCVIVSHRNSHSSWKILRTLWTIFFRLILPTVYGRATNCLWFVPENWKKIQPCVVVLTATLRYMCEHAVVSILNSEINTVCRISCGQIQIDISKVVYCQDRKRSRTFWT